jgi:endonuclease YncB( thermonuclease family)
MDLSSITDAPDFSKCVDGKTLEAKVISVYDGDSIKVIFPLNGEYFRWSCRLNGVDTPEIRTKNLKEKEMGLKVRDLLREKILDKIVTLKCGELDKYGRLLIDITYENENINKWLIDNNYAYEYTGGTKKSWDL